MNQDNTEHPVCCYKECTDNRILDARIEVKTVMPTKKAMPKFLISWRSNGEAEFHSKCWDKVITASRSRSSKKGACMTKEEKSMVKLAAEAPEQFDSIDSMMAGAKCAANWIKEAKHLVAFTGAGISTSAGIGDYRGKAGKWTEEDQTYTVFKTGLFNDASSSDEPPSKKSKLATESVSCEDKDSTEEDEGVPYEKLRPTYTHEALNKLREDGYLKYIISQNGDGLHGLSGIPPNQISELHGNVFTEICEKCKRHYTRKFYVMDDIGSQYFEEMEDYGETSVKKPRHAKKCERCGLSHRTGRKCESQGCKGFLRDTIINFRDLLDEDTLDKAWEMSELCDVMLCLGTTLQVTPACDLIKNMKRKNKLIICNRQETPVDDQFADKIVDGSPRGCRVFGDCDVFMQEVMGHIYSADDLQQWEKSRPRRMKEYSAQRD